MTNKDKERFVKLMDAYRNGTQEEQQTATEEIFNEVKAFIGYIINKSYPTFLSEYQDLYQEGALAVIESIPNYDPEKGSPATYFRPRIQGRLSKYFNARINKSNRYFGKKIRLVRNAIAHYEEQGITASIWDIVNFTDLKVKSVKETLAQIERMDSECSYLYESEMLTEDYAPDSTNPVETAIRNEEKEILMKALSLLPEDEREIVLVKYGFKDGVERSIQKTADEVGCNVRDVKRCLSHANRVLRGNSDLRNLHDGDKRDKVVRERNRQTVDFLNADPDDISVSDNNGFSLLDY